MLLKFISCSLKLTAAATCVALSASTLPDLPEPVTNNAVASTSIRGKTYIVSFMGIGPGKQHSDIHNKVFMHTLGEFGWQTLPPVPSQQRLNGRVAASAVALNNNFFVFGGFSVNADGSEQPASDSYRLDPITRRYTKLNDIPVPVDDAVALTYQNRYIYLVSGWSDHGNVNLVQQFDNFTQRWSQATPFPGKPVFGLAGAMAGNTMLLCDGVALNYYSDKKPSYQSEPACYLGIVGDNANKIDWRLIAHPTGTARYRMAAINSQIDGKDMLVFIGGSTNPYNYNGIGYNGQPSEPDSKVWVFSVAEKRWLKAADTTAVMDLRSLIEIDGQIYSVGGMQSGQQVSPRLIHHPIKLQ
ncbi:Kelch repeat-containing protein [Rheinheimera nanhaiensis]|uniref:Kelch motif domain-containing protein n=1 Tax=Rheinheimera nanhaiensis E407-8 TaxID=562729 RepID=I1DX33_9GAMM|nr:kelch motif domain-containing protein [Rheinheimera nanhaiensis]GAB58611.1 kelch motif domain-containing protein [Rheinheimera nanhaiensis E407-8]